MTNSYSAVQAWTLSSAHLLVTPTCTFCFVGACICAYTYWIKLPCEPKYAVFLSEDRDVIRSLLMCLQNIESRLKVLLPEDVGAALMDGVVLCHLANHICPRSVASIHVPSPAVVSTLRAILNHKCHRVIDSWKIQLSNNVCSALNF